MQRNRTATASPRAASAALGAGSPEGRAPRDGAILALLCLAQFMGVMDGSIMNVALDSIHRDLHFTATGMPWVLNAYTLPFTGFLMFGGRLADFFGRRAMFLVGLSVFTAASLLGTFAQDRAILLAARVLMGLGASALTPSIVTILTTTFPEGPRRARAMGYWSAVTGSAIAVGSMLGGVLTDLISWRATFFVNVPLGVGALIAAWFLIHDLPRSTPRPPLDILGAVLVTGGMLALVYGILTSEHTGWTGSGTVVPLVAGVVLLALFLLHESRGTRHPLLPPRLLRVRSVSAANVAMMLLAAGAYPSLSFLALYLQNVLGYTPMQTGLSELPMAVALAAGAQLSSRLLSRIAPRKWLVLGTLTSFAGYVWLGWTTSQGYTLTGLVVPTMLATLGFGLAMTPLALSATAGTAPGDAGLASALMNTTRMAGFCFGVAIMATIAATKAGDSTDPHVLSSAYSDSLVAGAVFALIAFVSALLLPSPPAPKATARD
ncbi:MFS transporter [Streptomyces sp. TR1341]|uniref:MFS transporter n=1 Tax=Streptomyces sp. TR1341 TaxID=2601266 RepID=UPI00138AEAAC|nr:MFS transporter [Streptomyces sp. TR1341]